MSGYCRTFSLSCRFLAYFVVVLLSFHVVLTFTYCRFLQKTIIEKMSRMGFEPMPFRTSTWNWRLRPTRPSWLDDLCLTNLIYYLVSITKNIQKRGIKREQNFSKCNQHSVVPQVATRAYLPPEFLKL